MFRTRSLVMGLALTLALVASSQSQPDVVPVFDLTEMAPDHACYFLCYLCLDGQPDDMMVCANTLCSRVLPGATCGPVLDFDLFRLGQQCPDLQDLIV
ncbi:uncharacterized protein [Littorina saxatilis]|uniref:Uncharacterized protein n=1 Tax=Littorina saxatilis TaxID=31220 RepID=A0AAN9AQH6_9CAEN